MAGAGAPPIIIIIMMSVVPSLSTATTRVPTWPLN